MMKTNLIDTIYTLETHLWDSVMFNKPPDISLWYIHVTYGIKYLPVLIFWMDKHYESGMSNEN